MSSAQHASKGQVSLDVHKDPKRRGHSIARLVWRPELASKGSKSRGSSAVVDFRNPLNFCGEQNKDFSFDRPPLFLLDALSAYTTGKDKLLEYQAVGAETRSWNSDRDVYGTVIAYDLDDTVGTWYEKSEKWSREQFEAVSNGPSREIELPELKKLEELLDAELFQEAMVLTVKAQQLRQKWVSTRFLGLLGLRNLADSYMSTFSPEVYSRGKNPRAESEEFKVAEAKRQKMRESGQRLNWIWDTFSAEDSYGDLYNEVKGDTYSNWLNRLDMYHKLRNEVDTESGLQASKEFFGNKGKTTTREEGRKQIQDFLDAQLFKEFSGVAPMSRLAQRGAKAQKTSQQFSSGGREKTRAPAAQDSAEKTASQGQGFSNMSSQQLASYLSPTHENISELTALEGFKTVEKKPRKPRSRNKRGKPRIEQNFEASSRAMMSATGAAPQESHTNTVAAADQVEQVRQARIIPGTSVSSDGGGERYQLRLADLLKPAQEIDGVFKRPCLQADTAGLGHETELTVCQTDVSAKTERESGESGVAPVEIEAIEISENPSDADVVGQGAEADVSSDRTISTPSIIGLMNPDESLDNRLVVINQSLSCDSLESLDNYSLDNYWDRETPPVRRRSLGEVPPDRLGTWSIADKLEYICDRVEYSKAERLREKSDDGEEMTGSEPQDDRE